MCEDRGLASRDRSPEDSRAHRQALVETLRSNGHLRSPRVAAALLAVPREVFVPDLSLEAVYRPSEAIVIKRVDGASVSSASAPDVIALMLEQLDPRPGDHVLEIGAGSGYNAALLAHLVGESGRVVSLDIDEDLVLSAREHLAAAGYSNVSVIQADGGLGYPAKRPYDRIILSVASSDLAPAWYEQLARPRGRLVMPLALRSLQRCLVFEPIDDEPCLVSRSLRACSFVSLRGVLGASDLTALDAGAAPTGVRVSLEELRAGLHLWLVAREPSPIAIRPDETEVWGELWTAASGATEATAERLRALMAEWVAAGQPQDSDVEIRACSRSAGNASGSVNIEQRWSRFELNWLNRPRS